jgi:hypothetical protein
MTVCVAALCESGKTLVIAADREIGLPFVKGQLEGQKVRLAHFKWAMLIAGNDVAPVEDIRSHAWDNFDRHLKANPNVFIDDAIKCVTDAFKKKRIEDAEALYLAPRGWTLDEFKQFGQQRMPLNLYLQIDNQMERSQLEITLLVAGFDDSGYGHIFTVHDPGIAVRHNVIGFEAIGSGGVAATSMLFYRKAAASMPISKALYHVYEAKVSGENAPGVGEETDIWIMSPDQNDKKRADFLYVGSESQKTMRKLWDKVRPREIKNNDLLAFAKLNEIVAHEKKKQPAAPKASGTSDQN